MRHAELDTRHTILLQATVKIARFLVAVIRIGKEAIEGSPFRKKPGITDRIFPGIRRIRQKCRVFQAIVLDGTVKPAGADIPAKPYQQIPFPCFQCTGISVRIGRRARSRPIAALPALAVGVFIGSGKSESRQDFVPKPDIPDRGIVRIGHTAPVCRR